MQLDEEVDEDFEKELAALMTDFKLPPSGPFPQAAVSMGSADRQEGADAGSTVSFRVMMKRGGRDDRSKAVQVCSGLACYVLATRIIDFRHVVAIAQHQ